MAYYNILLNLTLLDLSRFVGFNFGLIENSAVRISWLIKIYPFLFETQGLEVCPEQHSSRGGCSYQSPAL